MGQRSSRQTHVIIGVNRCPPVYTTMRTTAYVTQKAESLRTRLYTIGLTRTGLVHAATLAACSGCVSDGLLDGGILRLIGYGCLGDKNQRCNGCRVLKCGTGDLNRVKNTHLNHIAILAGCGIKTLACGECLDLLDNYAALKAGIVCNGANRSLKCLADDLDTDLLVCVNGLNAVEYGGSREERNAAAGNDALFNSRTGCLKCVLNAVLDLLELNLGSRANLDNCYAAGQFCQAKSEVVFSISPLIWLMRSLMASLVPLPSTMVVLSLVTLTDLARPSISAVTSERL